MIIIALIAALVFYFVMYLVWHQTQGHIQSLSALMQTLENMVFMPENLFFAAFRLLLVLAVLYVLGDQLRAWCFRFNQRRKARKEPMKLRYKDPSSGKP